MSSKQKHAGFFERINNTRPMRAINTVARAIDNFIRQSQGSKDLGGWLAHGSTELMNVAIHGNAAPMYAQGGSPPEQGNIHGHSPEAIDQLQKFELDQRMERMHEAQSNADKHNAMSESRDQQFYDTKRSQEAMASRAANYQPPDQSMSR